MLMYNTAAHNTTMAGNELQLASIPISDHAACALEQITLVEYLTLTLLFIRPGELSVHPVAPSKFMCTLGETEYKKQVRLDSGA